MRTLDSTLVGVHSGIVSMGWHIPNPLDVPGWVKDHFESVGSFVTDPIGYVSRALQAVYALEAWFFESVIAHPIRFSDSTALDYLYGNSSGLALSLIPAVFIVTLCLAIFVRRYTLSVVEITIVGGVLLGSASLWFVLTDEAMSWGDTLAQVAMFSKPADHEGIMALGLDAATAPILLIPAFFFTSFFGSMNILVVYAYEALNVFIRFAGLPLIVLAPLHPRIARLRDWCISTAIVSMIVGRFVMVLCIQIGQVLGSVVLGGTAAGTVFFLVAGMALSLFLQFRLLKEAQAIVGRVKASIRGQVGGTVDAFLKNKPKISSVDHNRLSSETIRPVPVVLATGSTGGKGLAARGASVVRTEIKHEARSRVREHVKKVTTTALAAGAAAVTGGTSAAATAAASTAMAARKPPPQSSPE